jgi:rubrerythrin
MTDQGTWGEGPDAAVLRTAVEIEEFGIGFYRGMSGCVADQKGSTLLQSLANDEVEHKRMLEKEIDRLSGGKGLPDVKPLEEYLRILSEKIFVPPPKGACLVLKDEISALEKGIDVEINSIRMYRDAIPKASDETMRQTLSRLADWEGTHKRILEENLRYLQVEGSWYGYSPILEG